MKEKKKLKSRARVRRRFNVIDVALLLFIVGMVVLIVNLLSPISFFRNMLPGTTYTLEYTVEISNVDVDYVDMVKENDAVMDSVSKKALGTVIAVDCDTQYSELQYDEQNQVGILATHPDRYNMLITITAECTYEEGVGYMVNDQRIAVGEKIALRLPDFVGEGYCTDFSVVN